MSSQSHSSLDVRFINTSNAHLKHWCIVVSIFGHDGGYLGKGEKMVSEMPPGRSVIGEIIFLNTHISHISRWDAEIMGIVNSSGMRADSEFYLISKEQ
jgi:hypothetical protein